MLDVDRGENVCSQMFLLEFPQSVQLHAQGCVEHAVCGPERRCQDAFGKPLPRVGGVCARDGHSRTDRFRRGEKVSQAVLVLMGQEVLFPSHLVMGTGVLWHLDAESLCSVLSGGGEVCGGLCHVQKVTQSLFQFWVHACVIDAGRACREQAPRDHGCFVLGLDLDLDTSKVGSVIES